MSKEDWKLEHSEVDHKIVARIFKVFHAVLLEILSFWKIPIICTWFLH
jgi:hypothetical protein